MNLGRWLSMRTVLWGGAIAGAMLAVGAGVSSLASEGNSDNHPTSGDRTIKANSSRLLNEGRQIFRFDTFGDEQFWTDTIQLNQAIEGSQHGGVGSGVSPKVALTVAGLKVDVDALPDSLKKQLKKGKVDLDDPAVTVALIKLNAVVGVVGKVDDDGSIRSMGLTCAVCHSTVDNSFAPGIGHRLDGYANRDLNPGLIISLAPDLTVLQNLLGVDRATVNTVLNSWGPGKFDAELDKDGKAFRPDGGDAATLIPAAYGLTGVNLHTWTGFGSIPYWNAWVAVTELHGQGTFFDPRIGGPLDTTNQYPVAKKSGASDSRPAPGQADLVTSKLAALQYYQLSIPAPNAPKGSFDPAAAARGQALFVGKAQCATCHTPPLYTEPRYAIHTPPEMQIDSFQADRSPTHGYRTAPLAGIWAHQKGGFYHDGRYATLDSVVASYNVRFNLGLTDAEQKDLVQFLLSI